MAAKPANAMIRVEEDLFEAIRAGDLTKTQACAFRRETTPQRPPLTCLWQELLSCRANVNSRDGGGYTDLCISIRTHARAHARTTCTHTRALRFVLGALQGLPARLGRWLLTQADDPPPDIVRRQRERTRLKRVRPEAWLRRPYCRTLSTAITLHRPSSGMCSAGVVQRP